MMGTNRKQPFGYQMEFGQVVLDPLESSMVQYIFQQYNLGASFLELAKALQEQSVPYDGDRPWNKNMVARILADVRYCGDGEYPVIIDQDSFDRAKEKRSRKYTTAPKTDSQKMLRRKYACLITPQVEDEVLSLLNSLARNPERIATPKTSWQQAQRVEMLKLELEDLLRRLPVDEEQTREKLMDIAVAMYETIDPREYETYRMRELFRKEAPRAELDANLIAKTISEVLVDGTGAVRIKLKNEQIIERGE